MRGTECNLSLIHIQMCIRDSRYDNQYDIDDIILSEYGTTVVGLEMMRSVNEENAEETRKVQILSLIHIQMCIRDRNSI